MKFFVQLRHSIDQDMIFQLVLNKIQSLVDNVEHLSFKEALDEIVDKEKSRIHRAFANVKKCESNDVDAQWAGIGNRLLPFLPFLPFFLYSQCRA